MKNVIYIGAAQESVDLYYGQTGTTKPMKGKAGKTHCFFIPDGTNNHILVPTNTLYFAGGQ